MTPATSLGNEKTAVLPSIEPSTPAPNKVAQPEAIVSDHIKNVIPIVIK